METIKEILVQVLVGLLVIALPILTEVSLRYIKLKITELKNELNEQQLRALNTVVMLAVTAAEQYKLAEKIADKKEWAIKYAERELRNLGYNVPLETISDAVESVLWREINSWQKSQ